MSILRYMAPNPKIMQILAKQTLHTKSNQAECKIIPQENQKSTKNSQSLEFLKSQ